MLLVMVEVLLVLVPPISPPRKLIWAQTCMIYGFSHIRIITHHSLWCHLGVGIIKFNMLMVLHLVLNIVMVDVVLFLGQHTSPPRKFFVFSEEV